MKHVLYFISSQVAQFTFQNESAVHCLGVCFLLSEVKGFESVNNPAVLWKAAGCFSACGHSQVETEGYRYSQTEAAVLEVKFCLCCS